MKLSLPSLQPTKTRGSKHNFRQKSKQWCSICWKKGHRTQACWWNSNQQRQQQHLQHQAWYNPNKQQHKPAEASKKRSQNQVYKTDKPVAYNSLAYQLARSLEHKTPAASFEHQAQATTQPACTTQTSIIAQMDSFEHASSTTEAWGILVDTGAATSVAPRSFASDIELIAQHLPHYSLQQQQAKQSWPMAWGKSIFRVEV